MLKGKTDYLMAYGILLIAIVIGWIVMDTYQLKHTTYRVTQIIVLKPAQTNDTKITHVQKTDTATDSMVIVPVHPMRTHDDADKVYDYRLSFANGKTGTVETSLATNQLETLVGQTIVYAGNTPLYLITAKSKRKTIKFTTADKLSVNQTYTGWALAGHKMHRKTKFTAKHSLIKLLGNDISYIQN